MLPSVPFFDSPTQPPVMEQVAIVNEKGALLPVTEDEDTANNDSSQSVYGASGLNDSVTPSHSASFGYRRMVKARLCKERFDLM
jgi:hypothetical protein